MLFFTGSSRAGAAWFPVGLASTFPDLDGETEVLSNLRPCGPSSMESRKPGCKVFHVPKENSAQASEVAVVSDLDSAESDDSDSDSRATSLDLKDQVLVFRYRGKFHAVDHQCPHASFPLSKAAPFDIEDFGVALSAGLTCPKHGWSFDLFTGMGDRGNYKLKLWEVEVRPGTDSDASEQEVWVRRKQRMG
ncbi:hypothetical protein C8R46DRAFT_436516 [Mycena filopes]|nr:hypothetical protein C8R46DRAFT_436516 [Mycena filopes]